MPEREAQNITEHLLDRVEVHDRGQLGLETEVTSGADSTHTVDDMVEEEGS